MALNSGYTHFEGLAYFGYSADGEGYDAVVVIGEHSIEIRDMEDRLLSRWSAQAYTVNDEEIPLRAYFCGEEWIAPRDEELRAALDRFLPAPEEVTALDTNTSNGFLRRRIAIGAIIACIVGVVVYFGVGIMAERLIGPSIRTAFDEEILAPYDARARICSIQEERAVHSQIRQAFPKPDFQIVNALGGDYASLPSGKLAIDADFAGKLGNAQTLIALLQLARIDQIERDPAMALYNRLPFFTRLRFLFGGEIAPEKLRAAWQQHVSKTHYPVQLYNYISRPIGDFERLANLLPDWQEGDYPAEAADISLNDQEWLSLITICAIEE